MPPAATVQAEDQRQASTGGPCDQTTERHVIGFEARGKLSAEDYRDVIIPVLQSAAEAGEVRFVVVIPDFDRMTGGALWEDLKVGIEHLRAWKRIALVTDIDWMRQMTALFGWMTPGETRTFLLAQRDEALEWVAGGLSVKN